MIGKKKSTMLMSLAVVTFFSQWVLVFSILTQIFKLYDTELWSITDNIWIVFARFICATILHLGLIDNVSMGLSMMKYAANHPHKFESYFTAWFVGFMNFSIVLAVEFTNVLLIMTGTDFIDITFNFIALAIIADFDTLVYGSLRNESFKKLLDSSITDKMFPITFTTSRKCKEHEFSTVLNEDGDLMPLRVFFAARGCVNKMCYLVYKACRIFYCGFYFYFMPFSVVVFSFLLPFAAAEYKERNNGGFKLGTF